MKLFISLILSISFLFAQSKTKNIAVLDMDPTGITEDNARFLSDRLRSELFNTGAFNVVEREKMNTILEEQGFQQSGCSSVECAVEIGQLLNVQQMVAGSIGKIEDLYSISLRLIDVSKGTILQTATRDFEGSLSEVLTNVVPEIAQMLADKENSDSPIVEKDESASSPSRWGLQVKIGTAALNYIDDINSAIRDFNATRVQNDLDELPISRLFGLEIMYDVSESWRYRAGINLVNQSGTWSYRSRDYLSLIGDAFDNVEFDQSYSFTSLFIGVDYKKVLFENFNLIIGTDFGLYGLIAKLDQKFTINSGNSDKSDDEYNESKAAIKIRIGFDYLISERVGLHLYAEPILASKFEIKEQKQFDSLLDFREIVYPQEINASGALFHLGMFYYF